MNDRIRKGLAASTDTRRFVVGPGALDQVAGTFVGEFGNRAHAVIIADDNTWAAAGARVHEIFGAAGIATDEPVILPGTPMLEADYGHIEKLVARLTGEREAADAAREGSGAIPVAVGAGTINDIVKRAAFELGRRYMCIPTAASVDGYASFGAAIRKGGYKQTMECPAPAAIVAEAEVLVAAPADLTAAGYADLASEITAGADWLLADRLGIEPIHDVAWSLIQPHLTEWLVGADLLREGDPERLAAVFEGLTMNGFAMQAMVSSRPASGAEHLYSHIWEMEHLTHAGAHVSHGFKVAIGTLASTALWELALDLSPGDVAAAGEAALARWQTWESREAAVRTTFEGRPYLDSVLAASRGKFVAPGRAAEERIASIVAAWPAITAAALEQVWPYPRLREAFAGAGVPTAPEHISLTRERVTRTTAMAQMIRTRYTILDALADLGLLERFADEIERSEVYLRA